MDDISTNGPTTLAELENGKITTAVIDTRWRGVVPGALPLLLGGDAAENAALLIGVLDGSVTGAKRDLALVNAAAGFVVAGLATDLREGLEFAREQVDSGRALAKLHALQHYKTKASR